MFQTLRAALPINSPITPVQFRDLCEMTLSVAHFRKVTPELIRKTAQEYLRKTNRTVVIVNVDKSNAAGGVEQ